MGLLGGAIGFFGQLGGKVFDYFTQKSNLSTINRYSKKHGIVKIILYSVASKT